MTRDKRVIGIRRWWPRGIGGDGARACVGTGINRGTVQGWLAGWLAQNGGGQGRRGNVIKTVGGKDTTGT